LNGDGYVDLFDMQSFALRHGLTLTPAILRRLSRPDSLSELTARDEH
jgi:hypothetical protein